MYITDHILNLIVRKLKGEATAEELQQLQSWMLTDSLHMQAHDELSLIWKESSHLLQAPHFNTGAAWAVVEQKIALLNQRDAALSKSSPVRYIRRFAIAAAIGTLALTCWYIWNNNRITMQSVSAIAGTRLVQLPDGSQVWLRKGSKLDYPASFNGSPRIAKLTGEAFFDIQHNENQPFVISTLHTKVKVLGTAFLVNTAAKSDEVIVARGKVLVTDNDEANNAITLEEGQEVIVQDHLLQRTDITDSNYISWKTGLLNFKEAALSKVLRDVSDYYNVTIAIPDSEQAEAKKLSVTVRFENQSLTQVLDEIRLITGWNMKMEKDKIIFYKNNAVFK